MVRVRATSLNYRDLMVATGRYGPGVPLPLVPLSDGAGEIAAVGDGVTRWKPGDRVAGTFFQNWQSGPVAARSLRHRAGRFHQRHVVRICRALGRRRHPVAAALELRGSAQRCRVPRSRPGTRWSLTATFRAAQTVVVLGTGGVSIFALQFAKMHGARVIITSSNDAKLARAKALGADEVINYRTTPDWEKEVFRITDKAGADHIVEVGGADTFPRSLRAVAMGGTISVIGGVSGFTSDVALRDILGKSAVIRGIFVGSRDMFAAMNRAISLHRLKPEIDRVFPFAEAPAAYRYQESGAHFGKVVVTVDS